MCLKVLIGCYLIMVATILFNKKIIDTQDIDDNQVWHWYQLLQWIIIYGIIGLISNEWILLIGFALTYPFFYDGLLNLLRDKSWFDEGDEGYGKSYTIPKRIKILFLISGIIIITSECLKQIK